MAQVFPLLHGENVRTMKGMVRIGGIGMGGVCAVFIIACSGIWHISSMGNVAPG